LLHSLVPSPFLMQRLRTMPRNRFK
jgi:hypothetical protein